MCSEIFRLKFNAAFLIYSDIEVPRRYDDERNNILLELIQYDNREKRAFLLGSVEVHLYEVIQKGCFIEEVQVLHRNVFVCRLEVEFMFSYGNFGYGFSHQLKPLQKITEPSMFMNPAPPPERTDPVTFRLEKMKKEYRNLNTWIDKANYLESILMPKLEHKDTEETNVDEASENPKSDQSEEELENVAGVADIPLVNEEAETTPNELLDNDSEKGLTVPTLNQLDQDNSTADASKSDESPSPTEVHSLCTISNQEIIKAGRVPPLGEHQSESMPDRKMENVFSPSEVKLKDNYPSILKADSSLSEDPYFPPQKMSEYVIDPHFVDGLIQDKPYRLRNINRKGKADCSDKFEDLHDMTSFIHFKKVKSRSRLLGKSSDDIHNHARHSARPYTAPEVNKQRESYSGKFTSRRMVSSGLVHINDKTSYCEMQKMRPKKIKRGY
ncbi:PREDICTED: amyotrophic lateral sclerosis 2 chromosomal region candidate gene 11 protein [Rhinopithecus bieti]|uniref:amyotrophic lateral sclerosis 2 chromosomal region candidate gene 11 protein n=1 Tax=Rhinopithecus bieti TaxID=61621 RepID=UPI00083C62D9|nr:PREDICTED: amyotrophic lateral sclerosis 2 chromosomal region candidate gene 11 protein [Rhinopithecus bieti]